MNTPRPAGRVLRPGDPALNALAELPAADWPTLAGEWLAAGFDSQLLRDFAVLDRDDADELAAALLPEVLRSLGLPVGPDELSGRDLYELSGFADRCRVAVDVVQRDLVRTGFGEYRLQPMLVSVDPGWGLQVCAALPDGTCGSEMGNPMTADTDDDDLIMYAALTACDTLLLVAHVRWPRCVQHRQKYLVPHPPHWAADRPGLRPKDDRAWWWCNSPAVHLVGPIGELIAAI